MNSLRYIVEEEQMHRVMEGILKVRKQESAMSLSPGLAPGTCCSFLGRVDDRVTQVLEETGRLQFCTH